MPCRALSSLLKSSKSTFTNNLHRRHHRVHPSAYRRATHFTSPPLQSPTTSKLSYPNKKPRRASNAVHIPGLSTLADSQSPYDNPVNPFPMAIESIENDPGAQYARVAPSYNGLQNPSASSRPSPSAGGQTTYGDNATNYGAPYSPYYNTQAQYVPSSSLPRQSIENDSRVAPSYNGLQHASASPRPSPSAGGHISYGDNATNNGAPYRPYYNMQAQYVPSSSLPQEQPPYMRQTPSSPHGTAYGAYNSPQWPPTNTNTNSYQLPNQLPRMPVMSPQSVMNGMPSSFPFMPFAPMPAAFQGLRPMSSLAGPPIEPPQVLQPTTQPERQRSMTPPMKVPVASKEYMDQAQQDPKKTGKRPLLIILDLNGTLIYRKRRKFPPSFVERQGLREFLDELCANYSVMVWTSSKPETCHAIVSTLFPVGGKQKKSKLVACWGRDKFDLNKRQYNAKLQVYKELHKVWNTLEIQREYPSIVAKAAAKAAAKPKGGKGGKFAKNKPKADPQHEFPEGHRWDQTNTILIDDSKIKALSEPYNILEIPEFTNDPSVDESTLFRRVLVTLDALAHHDDVSKVFRVWEERQAKQYCKVLDLDISPELPPAFEDEDGSEDGGAELPQIQPAQTQTQPAPAQAQSAQAQTQAPTKAQKTKKAEKRERQKQRKRQRAQELAAQRAAEQAESSGVPGQHANGLDGACDAYYEPTGFSAEPNDQADKGVEAASNNSAVHAPASASASAQAVPAAGTKANAKGTPTSEEIREARISRRKAAKQRKKEKKALAKQEGQQQAPQQPPQRERQNPLPKALTTGLDPIDQSNVLHQGSTSSRYNLRSAFPKTSAPSVPASNDPSLIAPSTDNDGEMNRNEANQSPTLAVGSRQRSISPATSDESRCSLLDRLEEGLGLKK